MADLCPRCGRPAISDLAFWQRLPVPAGACPSQGGTDCEDAREERVRRLERVAVLARRTLRFDRAALVDLVAALRALDGEG